MQGRIATRRERWSKRKEDDPVLGKFRNVVDMVLRWTQLNRELALIDALPASLVLGNSEIECYLMHLDSGVDQWVLLFTSERFSHAFRFHSSHVSQVVLVEGGDGLRSFRVQEIIESARQILHDGFDVRRDIDRALGERSLDDLILLRVDVLILCAIWLATDGKDDQARKFVEAAQAIPATPRSLRQQEEVFYLKCLLERIDWRRQAYSQGGHNIAFDDVLAYGVRLLGEMERGGRKYFPGEGLEFANKRIAVLVAGFARELYAYAARNNLQRQDWPITVSRCLEILEAAYDESMRRNFYYTAMRARQRYLQFARMYERKRLPLGSVEAADFSADTCMKMFREMHEAMQRLRDQSRLDDKKFPFTAILSETIGLWRYRDALEVDVEEIASSIKRLEDEKGGIPDPDFRREVNRILEEMREFVRQQTPRRPD